MHRNVCILGGSGFVGRRLAAKLGGAGYRLVIPTRSRTRNRRLLVLPTAQLVRADIHDEADLARLFKGMDAVVNLAGILNERGRNGHGFTRVHVELVEKIVRGCSAAGVPRLLHLSTLRADESGPSHYLRSKGRGERVIHEHQGQPQATIFQPSVIFGAEDNFSTRFARLLRLCPGVLPLARPNARFAPVFVDDVARAIAKSLEDPATHGGSYQLCGPQIYSLKEIVQFVALQRGLRTRVWGLPDSLARLQGRLMDFVPGKPFSTDNYLSLTVNSICERNGLEYFGISPRSLDSVAPTYLSELGRQQRYSRFRRSAGR